ncbi:MAG: hypothetical protein KDH94_05740, partial [Coxiellaceae bacterium]|nr:hypothetical protein [Coxiellaceae bacterium]
MSRSTFTLFNSTSPDLTQSEGYQFFSEPSVILSGKPLPLGKTAEALYLEFQKDLEQQKIVEGIEKLTLSAEHGHVKA